MADSKISALPSGAPAQGGDEYVVARSGANYKLSLTNIAASMPDTTIKGSLVVNEDGADKDTRIEGDTDANLFFVDASTDRIGVGTATPAQKVDLASGNLIFSSTSQKILGKFDGSWSNRTVFQNYTTNAESRVGIIPNGTNSTASWSLSNSSSDPANSGSGSLRITNTALSVNSNSEGTGTPLPMHFNLYDAAESSGGTSTTRMVILNNGNVGVGTTSPNEKLSVSGTFTASTGASIGCNVNGTIPSSATLFGFSYQSNTSIQDASFTLTNWAHFAAYPGAIGASATVTNQFGVYIDSSLTGATNNYGLYSNIASGSNRWNFYAAGTAQNYFAGNVLVGTTTAAAGGLLTLNRAPAAAFGTPMLQVGGASFTSGGYYSIGLGFTDATYTEPPGEIALVTTADSGGTKGAIAFGTRDVTTNTAVTERMRISSDGNVGVNRTAYGSITTNGVWLNPNTDGLYHFGSNTSNGVMYINQNGSGPILSVNKSGSEVFGITNAGNVGIGTASPGNKLDISGNQGFATASYVFSYAGGTSAQVRSGLYLDGTNQVLQFFTGTNERMRIDSSGNVGIGTASPVAKTQIAVTNQTTIGNSVGIWIGDSTGGAGNVHQIGFGYTGGSVTKPAAIIGGINENNAGNTTEGIFFATRTATTDTAPTERMRIDSSGRVSVGTTSVNLCAGNALGIGLGTTADGTTAVGAAQFSANGTPGINVNRKTDDGALINFYQDGTNEGNISVSGNTVSYNAFAGSHWSQLQDDSKPSILRGTVMEAINELCVWPGEQNERLPKSKVSDTAGSKKVYGVFMAWDNDWTATNDMLITSVGAFICRVNGSVTVQEGDLLESNGDGTARVQADDIIRSSTIGKVTSTVKTHQYADGSYCVPTVLYCG